MVAAVAESEREPRLKFEPSDETDLQTVLGGFRRRCGAEKFKIGGIATLAVLVHCSLYELAPGELITGCRSQRYGRGSLFRVIPG